MLDSINDALNSNIQNKKEKDDLKPRLEDGILLLHDIKEGLDFYFINASFNEELPLFTFYLPSRYITSIKNLGLIDGKIKKFFDNKKRFKDTIKSSFSDKEILDDKLGNYSFANIFKGEFFKGEFQKNKQSFWFLKTIYPVLENVYHDNFGGYFYKEYNKIGITPPKEILNPPISQFLGKLELDYEPSSHPI